MDTGLTERDRQTIYSILANYPAVQSVTIFGSRVKGTFKPGSDIDLAIMNDEPTKLDLIRLKSEFDDSDLPYVVDIVKYPSIKLKELKMHIDRVGIPFYERPVKPKIRSK